MLRIADNLQITNPAVAGALDRFAPTPIENLVRECVTAGAQAIDINTGPLPRDSEAKMTFCVTTVQAACDLPLVIDTANPTAMAAGLKACRNRAIINGFSLEPVKLEKILPLAAAHNAAIIGYLLFPDGHVPPDADTRLNLAVDIWSRAQQAGIAPDKLIIDPVVVPVIWQDGHQQAMQILKVLQLLPDILGFDVKTIAGLSNLTAGMGADPRRLTLEQTYLAMLAGAGLDMVLLNSRHADTMATARACNALTSPQVFTLEGI